MLKFPDPRRFVGGVFPILQWSRHYDLKTGIGDLIAGITIALTLIPQSIAYASLAGFEPQYGLYASFVGGFVYGVMGTCPQINIGPTALLSLLTFTYTHNTNADFAILLCLISGIVQLIAGIAQLGFLVEFVSLPVVSGFTSAAAITIASSQIKGLLGLKFSAETFMATWGGLFEHIGETRLPDTLLSLACCIVLMGMKALKEIRIKEGSDEKGQRNTIIMRRALWFIGVSRNAVVVVLAAVLAFFVHQDKEDPLILTGDITPGLPAPRPPAFSTTVGNTTYTPGDMFSHMGSGLLVVPIVGIISNVAIAKAFARGKTLDATQEIVALAACNIVGAFFQSFPVNGSFTRSAVSQASGVKTPGAGFYTGIIVLLTLALLTPYFYFIPRAALAAVIVCAVLHMVDLAILKKLWATSRLDLIPLLGSFVCCLALGIEVGIMCGVGVDVLLLLYYHFRPPLNVQYVDDGVLPAHYSIHPVGGLHFAGAERVRCRLVSLMDNKPTLTTSPLESLTVIPDTDVTTVNLTNGSNTVGNGTAHTGNEVEEIAVRAAPILVVYCDSLYRLDYTFLQSMQMFVTEWSRSGRVIWCNVKPSVKLQLNSVLQDPVYCDTEHLRACLAGIIVLLTLALLTPYFYFIPRAALAAVIVCAVLHMVDLAILKKLWATSRLDLIPLLGSFVCCLALGIEVGIMCGVGVDVLLLLYYHFRPPLNVQYVDDGVLPAHYSIHPVGGLHFAGAERVRCRLVSLMDNKPTLTTSPLESLTVIPDTDVTTVNLTNGSNTVGNGTAHTGNEVEEIAVRAAPILVVYCDSLYRLDYTFLQSMQMFVTEWSRSGRVIWCNVKPSVKLQLNSVLQDPVYCDTEHLRACLAGPIEEQSNNQSDTQL